jgi:hypothetical protein
MGFLISSSIGFRRISNQIYEKKKKSINAQKGPGTTYLESNTVQGIFPQTQNSRCVHQNIKLFWLKVSFVNKGHIIKSEPFNTFWKKCNFIRENIRLKEI